MPLNVSDVVKTLRSLLNSTQNGLLERQLLREFRDMEGVMLPFRDLGFNTFTQFLEASKEFELINTSEGVHVRAKLSKSSVHIAQLVESQNRVKRKKNAKSAPFMSRPRNVRSKSNWTRPTAPNVS